MIRNQVDMIKLNNIDDNNMYFNERKIPYTIKKSNRKSLAIAIEPGGNIVVKIPLAATEADVKRLLLKKQDWIYSTYQKQKEKNKAGLTVKDGMILPVQDTMYPLSIKHQPYHKTTNIFLRRESQLLVMNTPSIEPLYIKECLEAWYRKYARAVITERVDFYANILCVTYGKIAIRSQKSRWGSCSYEGNLNFNWHLIMMPSSILDYVVIHELAHRIEMNHSKQFWAIVARICPEYKERKQWLKEYGLQYELVVD